MKLSPVPVKITTLLAVSRATSRKAWPSSVWRLLSEVPHLAGPPRVWIAISSTPLALRVKLMPWYFVA